MEGSINVSVMLTKASEPRYTAGASDHWLVGLLILSKVKNEHR